MQQTGKDNIVIRDKKKEEFLSNISHELKNPLTIIIWYTQLLKERNFCSDELYLIAIDNMESESKRLNLIINNMLEKGF